MHAGFLPSSEPSRGACNRDLQTTPCEKPCGLVQTGSQDVARARAHSARLYAKCLAAAAARAAGGASAARAAATEPTALLSVETPPVPCTRSSGSGWANCFIGAHLGRLTTGEREAVCDAHELVLKALLQGHVPNLDKLREIATQCGVRSSGL